MPEGYQVTAMEDSTITQGGRFVSVRVVHFRTASGDESTVDVPKDIYTADLAHEMIAREVAEMERTRG